MQSVTDGRKDVVSGILFIATAAGFAYFGRNLDFGTTQRIGPALFPLILCGVLVLLGVLTIAKGLSGPASEKFPVSWRGIVFVTGSVVFFGFAVRGLGFVPTLAVTVFAASLASRKAGLLASLATTIILVAASWAIFIKGLGLPLPVIGPWLVG